MPTEPSDSMITECIDCHEIHPPRTEPIPSPFRSLATLEISPTPAQTAAVRQFIREIDAEVVRQELAIVRLRCEVAELRRRAEQHEAIIAPVRRIPPEMIAEIFLQVTAIEAEESSGYLPGYKPRGDGFLEKGHMARPRLHRAPLILGEISREWRNISLSTPRLWCSLSLQCGAKRLHNDSARALCILWLKRAGSLPLSIRFYRSSWGFESQSPRLALETIERSRDLVKTILPYSNRWRFIDLQNLPPSSYEILHNLQLHSVPLLETISVKHDAAPTPSQSSHWAKLQVAPKLTQLSFDMIRTANIVVQGEGHTFPWSNLTRIDVGDCSADDCLGILRQALTAVACRFAVTKGSSLQHSSLVHSRLHTLEIHVHASLQPLWTHLTCSALSTLFVQARSHHVVPSFFQSLPDFIARSGSNVKDLTLDGSTLSDHQFMACLGDVPQLQRLRVSEDASVQFTSQVWESLTRAETENSPPPLIPLLESLHLSGAQESGHQAIVRMLKSRLQVATGPVELKRLRLVFYRNITESAERRLLKLRKLGLDIDVDADSVDDEVGGSGTSASASDEGDVDDERDI